jgi:membrane protease YdiL (CAAX protease family)
MFSSHLMHWDFAFILIFLATAVPLLGRRRIHRLMQMPETTQRDRLALYASTVAFQWLAAAVIVWRASAQGVSATRLGVALPHIALTATVSIVLAIIVLANQILSLRRLAQRPWEIQGVMPQLALKVFPQDSVERLAFFAVVITVSTCEELIYRGFAQAVFGEWFRSRDFALVALGSILASAGLFALGHVYQGRRGLLATFIVGILFSSVRAWTGSLFPSMLAHFAADWTAGIMAPSQLRLRIASPGVRSEETASNKLNKNGNVI